MRREYQSFIGILQKVSVESFFLKKKKETIEKNKSQDK